MIAHRKLSSSHDNGAVAASARASTSIVIGHLHPSSLANPLKVLDILWYLLRSLPAHSEPWRIDPFII